MVAAIEGPGRRRVARPGLVLLCGVRLVSDVVDRVVYAHSENEEGGRHRYGEGGDAG